MPLVIEGQECACLGDPTSHGSPLAPGIGALTVLYNGRPIWRVGIDFHACPIVKGVVPDVGGMVVKGALRTMVMGSLAARKGDMVVEVPGGPNVIIPGMMGVGGQAGQVSGAQIQPAADASVLQPAANGSVIQPEAVESPKVITLKGEVSKGPEDADTNKAILNRMGGLAPKDIPPGVDIQANIDRAKKMNPLELRDAVKNKGEWDYKQKGKQYQEFGNFHFGVVCAANGIPENVALRLAGDAQQRAGTSKPEWGSPLWGEPYGDDPDDQAWIKKGYEAYGKVK